MEFERARLWKRLENRRLITLVEDIVNVQFPKEDKGLYSGTRYFLLPSILTHI